MEEIEIKHIPRWRLEITLRLDGTPIHLYLRSMTQMRLMLADDKKLKNLSTDGVSCCLHNREI